MSVEIPEKILNLIPKDEFYGIENWKRINDDLYRDNYLISDRGRGFSIIKKAIMPIFDNNSLRLYSKNKSKSIRINLLVFNTFGKELDPEFITKTVEIEKPEIPLNELISIIPVDDNLLNENWKRVNDPLYYDSYLISDRGRGFSLIKNTIMPVFDNHSLRLYSKNKPKNIRINLLVFNTFGKELDPEFITKKPRKKIVKIEKPEIPLNELISIIPVDDNLVNEKWKRVNDELYEKRYLISDHRRGYSIQHKKILKPYNNNFRLYINKSYKSINIDTLVANAFSEKKEDDIKKEEIKLKPIIQKPQKWVVSEKKISFDKHKKRFCVMQYSMDLVYIQTFNSFSEAGKSTGAPSNHIPSVCNGKRNVAGKFKWRRFSDPKFEEPKDGKTYIGYSNYIITSNGEIYSKKDKIFLVLNDLNSGDIYKKIKLVDDEGNQKDFLIHTLIAELYLSKVEGKEYVKHIDGNKTNNQASNLEWIF